MDDKIVDTIKEVDQTFLFIFSIAAVLFFIISIGLIIILIRYNHKRHPEPASFKGSVIAELIWIIAPSLIVIAMFISGWKSYLALQTPPEGAMRIGVTARKWSWTFTYENGLISNILYVPENRSVFLNITSLDVLHSFFAPAFRIKRDAVPGMTTNLWFRTSKTGTFDAMCAEYCGLGHSKMRTKIVVLPKDEFDHWYEGGELLKTEEDGRELFVSYGCIGCHELGDIEGVGPSLQNIFGKKVVALTKSGEITMVADDEYLRRSILAPDVEVVKGYQAIMPSYSGQIPDNELDKIIIFLKSLHDENSKPLESTGG